MVQVVWVKPKQLKLTRPKIKTCGWLPQAQLEQRYAILYELALSLGINDAPRRKDRLSRLVTEK